MPDWQFYGAILWYHLMVPFYGMCVPGLITAGNLASHTGCHEIPHRAHRVHRGHGAEISRWWCLGFNWI